MTDLIMMFKTKTQSLSAVRLRSLDTLHQSTQHNMAVRLKACVAVTRGRRVYIITGVERRSTQFHTAAQRLTCELVYLYVDITNSCSFLYNE